MLGTITILVTANQTVSEADRAEKRYGRRGRLVVLATYPARMVGSWLLLQGLSRVSGPVRRLLRRPVKPAEVRIAAAWMGLLAGSGMSARTRWGGVSLSGLDNFSIANIYGFGGGVQLARSAALSDLELQAVLAHELAHLRLRHVVVISLAVSAMSAGWPLVVRKLLSEKAEPDAYPWLGVFEKAPTARDSAITGLSVATIAMGAAAVQRLCESHADDYAAARVGASNLASAIETLDAADTARNARPGPKAAFWRLDAAFGRTLGAPFASAPSSASRIRRLRKAEERRA